MKRTHSTPIEPQTPPKRRSPETGSESAGQSGDLQGLTADEDADSESVQELVEEGQYYEAEVVEGIENAPTADDGGVRVHKRSEDDLRPEYEDHDKDVPRE